MFFNAFLFGLKGYSETLIGEVLLSGKEGEPVSRTSKNEISNICNIG